MTVSGFPSILQFSRLNTAITELKSQSEQARVELATGRAADIGLSLGPRAGEGQLILKAINDVSSFRFSTQRGANRTSVIQLTLSRISQLTTPLGGDLLNALSFNDQNSIALAGQQARNDLETTVNSLNQRFEGQSLFAGDATDQPALSDPQELIDDVAALFVGAADAAQFQSDIEFYFNDPTGDFATQIYRGGSGSAPAVAVDENQTINANAKADEQEIRDVLRQLAIISVAGNAPASAKRDEVLSEAGADIIGAGAELTRIQGRIGIFEEQFQAALDRLDNEESVLTLRYNDLTARDQFEVASTLQQLETQLAASFTISSRISRLSLVNFL